MRNLRKIIRQIISESLEQDSIKEIKFLKKKLYKLENVELDRLRILKKWGDEYPEWVELVKKMDDIRRRLYQLTGDPYGETKQEKEKQNKKPKGVESSYNHPLKVPKQVYKWLSKNSSLLYSDATDAVRWYRIINTSYDQRYPKGEMTIYRAVDNKNYDEIRPGDWVTTEEKYAIEHNDRYFNGKGKIIEMDVNGRDVLVSPTGDREEAIYAPLELSLDIKY